MNNRHPLYLILAVATVVPVASWATPSAAAHKLAPRLAVIAYAATHQETEALMAPALTRQLFRKNSPLDARWNAAGQVQVYLHSDARGTSPGAQELAALGATGVVTSPELGVVQAWIPADKLVTAAALPGVTRITLPHYAVAKRTRPGHALPRTGSVDTQGDQILGAAQFRQLTGFNGQGIAVGVISDGDDHIAASQGTGDLPATIWNDPNNAGSFKSSGDEGTAMMEIVYDLAPGVQLGFCGPQTTVDFVTCLNDFVAHFGNSNLVIADDLGFPGVAMFTDGGFATAVKNFSIANPAVRLVTAAGNDAQGFWSGNWKPLDLPNAAVNSGNPVKINGITYSQIQNFSVGSTPTTQLKIGVQASDTLSWMVEWGDTWVPSNQITGTTPNDPNDYDVVLLDANGNVLACNIGINFGAAASPPAPDSCPYSGTAGPTNTPGPQPIQGNTWTNNTGNVAAVSLKILYAPGDGTPDTHIKVWAYTKKFQINMQPSVAAGSIYGQSALPYPYEVTAGAVAAQNNPAHQIEPYSSQGPVFLFQPASGASSRMKPDFVGVDGVSITGAGGFSNPFYGTSAAAPHIAGLIALLESGYPSADPYVLLKAGATPLGNGNPNGVYGYGLPDAARSVGSNYPAPLANITAPSGSSTISAGQSLAFTGTCSANGAPGSVTYNWNFGAASGVPDASTPNPTATFQFFGQYTVTLTCTNQFGVTSTPATLQVTVNAAPPAPAPGGKSGGGGGMDAGVLAGLLLAVGLSLRRRAPGTLHGR
ncbi:MAG TPA: PKD domain-containing protein [Gammaproteobacteria bacterium]|nr:PKD domain-containing protein [Gammaproteobacteria bacterium]